MADNPSKSRENRRLSICVFCGSSFGDDPAYGAAATEFGALLAARGHSFVFGGGDIGLMGTVARAARAGGAHVTSILPDFLHKRVAAFSDADEFIVTESMHERKARMFALADAFVVLPGGIGTIEEAIEVLTWAQLALHTKPIVLVNTKGYWDPLIAVLNHAIHAKFAGDGIMRCLGHFATPQNAMRFLEEYRPDPTLRPYTG